MTSRRAPGMRTANEAEPPIDALDAFTDAVIDPRAAWEMTAYLCGNPPPNTDQLVGSPSLEERIDRLIAELRRRGFDPSVQPFKTDVHVPVEWSLSLLGDDPRALPCLPMRYSAMTPPEGIETDVVEIGPGFEEDYELVGLAGTDPHDKIVLLDDYTVLAKSRLVTASLHGARGAILVNAYDHDYHGFMAGGWHRPQRVLRRADPRADLHYPLDYAYFKFMDETLPRIPVVTVRSSVGKLLHERAARGNLRVRLTWHKEIRPTVTRNVWLFVPGSRFPDEIVMCGAHVDSFYAGARDDVSECARVISAVEVLRAWTTRRGHALDRSLLVGFWSGEEASMLGSYAFFSEHPELMQQVVAYLNADNSAMAGGSRWVAAGSPLLRRPAIDVSTRVLGGAPVAPEWYDNVGAFSDHAVFVFDGGIPVLSRLPGWYRTVTNYHDNATDTIDAIDPESFRRPIAALVLLLDQLASADRLPYDLPAAADYLEREVRSLVAPAAVAGIDLRPVSDAVDRLRAAAQRLEAASPPADDDRLRLLNAALARVIAPRLTTLSHDTDGIMEIRVPQLAPLAFPDRLSGDARNDLARTARVAADTLNGLAAILDALSAL